MERILGRRFFSLVIVAVAVVPTTQTEAQDLPCIADLANCGEFYNNTALVPTEACCGPLASVLKNQVTCLCAVFNNPLIQEQLGINLQSGQELLNRCNITGSGSNICTSAAPASPPKKAPTPGGMQMAVILLNQLTRYWYKKALSDGNSGSLGNSASLNL